MSVQYKALQIRLYPTSEQIRYFHNAFGCVRFVYNQTLDKWNTQYQTTGKGLTLSSCNAFLNELKDTNIWLKAIDSTALQEANQTVMTAYNNFFKKNAKQPKFKSKKRCKNSYIAKYSNNNITLEEHYIKLPKIGKVKCSNNLIHFKDKKIVNVTISQTRSGKFLAFVLLEMDIPSKQKTNKTVGIDVGIKDFAILSNGQMFENQKHNEHIEKKLQKEQKKLSNRIEQKIVDYKVVGNKRYPIYSKPLEDCKNIQKQRIKIAKLHEKVANQRYDRLQKLSTQLVNDYDIITIEDLNVNGMLKNHKLAKHIQSCGWSLFRSMLQYKCNWYGKQLIVIDRWYPSSKMCSQCGSIKQDLTLKDRTYHCEECNLTIDRDLNAAININQQGLKILVFQ